MGQDFSEWVTNEWVVVADGDAARASDLVNLLEEIGFPRERLVPVGSTPGVIAQVVENQAAILIIDASIGTAGFREIHASMHVSFGEGRFFIFAVASGEISEFASFAAEKNVDGIITRPYRAEEFRSRVAEVFTRKWSVLYGRRDLLTPDRSISPDSGLRVVIHPAVSSGKKSFTQVSLQFEVTARNGSSLPEPVRLRALELGEKRAVFGSETAEWAAGDRLTIEADISHGEEKHRMKVEGRVSARPNPQVTELEFEAGSRVHFEAALKMVSKRFHDLKDFFKYAKGA